MIRNQRQFAFAFWLPICVGFLVSLNSLPVAAHGGGLDSHGCHHDRKAGGYHCHQGALAGQSFSSKTEAQKAINSPTSSGQLISGPARIIDGDSLEVAGIRIRLFGIDAPEMKQTCEWPNKTIQCGNMAKLAMMDMLATGGNLTCEPIEKDRYGRTVATCIAPNGYDIGQNMVYTGWALAYRRYSEKYVTVEDGAREARRGMWKGEFVPPWEWRRGKRIK